MRELGSFLSFFRQFCPAEIDGASLRMWKSNILAKPVTMWRALGRMWQLVTQDRWVIFAAFSALIVAALLMLDLHWEISIPHFLTASIFSARSIQIAVVHRNVCLLILLCLIEAICSGLRGCFFGIAYMILVQDPQKGQILGEGRRVGQLFELASLHLPQRFVFAATIPNSSIHQWHLHLGYASADNAVEYRDSYLLQFLSQQGTVVQHSCPHTSQQNGRAEREHHHIFDSVRTFLLFASCLEKFWGEVALHAVYIINRLPILVLHNLSPFKKLFGQSPDYSILKPFGCVSFVLLQPHEHTKLEPRARLCCFLGYDIEHKGYRC
ncbi:uncharacterized protein LOC110640683 isoform X4 [Hevea brasiliensis]|uniref:uncharacterized protein LOC110640683 isoform X4 n=1 Tax=Hevea brasiliensis TaxID=3981 RepID=UPI0025DE0185|nr:uncharacterized protein LOC110640683 isoform X4 [Hevea brasiliensis]